MDSDNTSILVTGATGFIGHELSHQLAASGFRVRAAVRDLNQLQHFEPAIELCNVGNINAQTPWQDAVRDVEVVVHLASGVDRSAARDIPLLAQFRAVNVAGTEKLARDAATAGARRLVFLSSIKVNGEHTHDKPFSENDPPRPWDAYGISKWEAEQSLWKIAAETGLEVVVLRAPWSTVPESKAIFCGSWA